MAESTHLLPHLERLLRRLDVLEAPLVQVWGWPGSGKAPLLQAFLARHGRRAVALALGDLAGDERLREVVTAAQEAGSLWLVAAGEPAADRLAVAAEWLRPGQRLLFASERRQGVEALAMAVLAPQELLLTPGEVATVWHLLTGGGLDGRAARALRDASDGWYRPLRFAIEATGGLGLDSPAPEQLLELPPVRFFLRHEVFESFSPEEQEALLAAPEERPAPGGEAEGREGWRLLDARGLWVDGEERDRLPRLLAVALERERRRRRRQGTGSYPVQRLTTSPRTRPAYHLRLLGSPLARQRDAAGERDLDCRLRRSFQVLAFLASSPRLEAGREELIEAVWPTEGERTIERNFHPTLSHLRRALEGLRREDGGPPALLFRSGVYRLNPEFAWEVDTLDFARLLEEGRELAVRGELAAAAEAFQTAWKLYRGPFLQGYYEAWVTQRREVFQRLYLELLRELGDLHVRLERPEEAMDAFRSVLLEDPLQERIHLAVMRLYSAQGRRDLVRRQYDRLCTLLLDELGVEPLPETTREYHRLMA
jgi:DNA-binding SARP family transcriptional activator